MRYSRLNSLEFECSNSVLELMKSAKLEIDLNTTNCRFKIEAIGRKRSEEGTLPISFTSL